MLVNAELRMLTYVRMNGEIFKRQIKLKIEKWWKRVHLKIVTMRKA